MRVICSVLAAMLLVMLCARSPCGAQEGVGVPGSRQRPQLYPQTLHRFAARRGGGPVCRVVQARSEFGVCGRDLAVVVVDSGINNYHISFQGQLLPGKNFSDEGMADDTLDLDGHGSNVAGIIAEAKLVAPREGMPTGIAPNCENHTSEGFPERASEHHCRPSMGTRQSGEVSNTIRDIDFSGELVLRHQREYCDRPRRQAVRPRPNIPT